MFGVENIEPSVEAGHTSAPIELGEDGITSKGRYVQTGIAGPLVQVLGEADVAACHTHTLHTVGNPTIGSYTEVPPTFSPPLARTLRHVFETRWGCTWLYDWRPLRDRTINGSSERCDSNCAANSSRQAGHVLDIGRHDGDGFGALVGGLSDRGVDGGDSGVDADSAGLVGPFGGEGPVHRTGQPVDMGR